MSLCILSVVAAAGSFCRAVTPSNLFCQRHSSQPETISRGLPLILNPSNLEKTEPKAALLRCSFQKTCFYLG
jgi:hypothetical protein